MLKHLAFALAGFVLAVGLHQPLTAARFDPITSAQIAAGLSSCQGAGAVGYVLRITGTNTFGCTAASVNGKSGAGITLYPSDLPLSGTDATTQAAVNAILGGGAVPATFPPRRGQFFVALEAYQSGANASVRAAVPPDPGNATNIAFAHTMFVVQGGTLAQFAKSTLGLTDAQLATVVANARSVTE